MVVFAKKSSRTKTKKKNSKQAKSSRNKRQSVKRTDGKSKTKNRTQTRTTSKSHTATPTKEKSEGRKAKGEKGRINEFKEKEPDSEGRKTEDRGTTDSVSKSKASVQSSQLEQTKKVEVKNIEPDAEHVKRMLVKMKREKPRAPQPPLDEKSKLLMDRVVKKPYPLKYTSKSKQELLMDEKSSFFKVSVPNPASLSKKPPEEDNYDDCPKLADILKMKNLESVYGENGVPFWAEYMEPTEKDMTDVDEPVSVGSLHLEAYNDKQLPLKTCQDKSVVTLNSFQPLSALKKRDEPYFHPHLVFSNTVRSMINAQNTLTTDPASGGEKNKKEHKEEKTPTVRFNATKTITVPARSPKEFVYLRSDPIGSAREAKSFKGKNATVTTTTTTTTDS